MNGLKEVRPERTGWRDLQLDEILLNENIWVPDSFLVSEYDHGKSVAIIEYKGPHGILKPDMRLVNYCNLRKNKEYYFIIRFQYERKKGKFRLYQFEILPGNKSAILFIQSRYKKASLILDEQNFIKFLYEIRNNTSSPYYQQTIENYEEWFNLDVHFDIEKNLISSRHRSYAYDVPAADIDSILFDSNKQPYLCIEYKANHNYGLEKDSGHNHFISSYFNIHTRTLNKYGTEKLWNQALIDLGNGCKNPIPVIAVEYNLEHDIFSLYALNKNAEKLQLRDFKQEEYFQYIKESSNFKVENNGLVCPLCGGKLVLKKSIYGSFYGCENFKKGCKYKKEKPE